MGVYSAEDYLVYGLILLVILFILTRFIFRRIAVDRKFLVLISPYILVGIFIRVLVDVGFIEESQYWSITPGVYILCISVGLVLVGLGLLLQKYVGVDYWIPPFFLGTVGAAVLGYILFTHITVPERIFYPLILASFLTIIIVVASRFRDIEGISIFHRRDNAAIVFAHLLDGSSSFIAINYFGFGEEHLLPRFFISLFGSAVVMIPLKLTVILLVIYFLEKWYRQEKEGGEGDEILYRVLKITIFILGIGPGLRNTLLPSLA
ncbi:MAG: DUF63 family protein [Candidatus Altiarchaeales archaeon]|nr:DUF63 family protein [Candidatus Altiarchaeales archaeon]